MSAQPLRKDFDTYNKNEGQGVVNVEFTTRQSLPARVERQRFGKKPVAANDNEDDVESRNYNAPRERFAQSRNVKKMLGSNASKRVSIKAIRGTAAKGMGEIFLWIGGAISALIFIFGILGLVLVFVGSTDFANALNTVVSIFTDPASLFGSEEVTNNIVASGMNLLLLNLAIAFASYLIFGLVFAFLGVSLFNKTSLFAATALCLALDMMPVTQLFPWMLVWIGIIELSLVTDT